METQTPLKLNELNLSRRKFCILASMLISKNVFATDLITTFNSLDRVIEHFGIDYSAVRVGSWMKELMMQKDIDMLITQVNNQLALNPISSMHELSQMISQDYLQKCTVSISLVRFSVIEAAICLTSHSCSKREAKKWY